MARVLVVDDDALGLDVRKMILEREGHCVGTAADPEQARAAFAAMVLPRAEDGLALIREFRTAVPTVRIVVLSGWSTDLDGRPERAMADRVLLGGPVEVRYRAPNDSEWVFVRSVTHSLTLGARFSGEWVEPKTHSLSFGGSVGDQQVIIGTCFR